MIRVALRTAIVDLLAAVSLYFVFQNLDERAAYAVTEHLSAGTAYSPLIRVLTVSGRSIPLVSPATLDWVQILILIAVVANGLFVYDLYRELRKRSQRTPVSAT